MPGEMNGNISDKFETTGLRFLAHVLQYPMVFTVIYVLSTCLPNDMSSQLSIERCYGVLEAGIHFQLCQSVATDLLEHITGLS